MTNEELDRARVDEAMRLWDGSKGSLAVIAARLAREGWTPPVTVDPDLKEAAVFEKRYRAFETVDTLFLQAIKRGRALAAEAKPGMVWVKHDGSRECPAPFGAWVTNRNKVGGYFSYSTKIAGDCDWSYITHYAVTTPPEDVA